MPRRFLGIAPVLRSITLSTFLLICSSSFSFAVTCDNPYNMDMTIGLEWIADQCVADGMNDSTSIHYITDVLTHPGNLTCNEMRWNRLLPKDLRRPDE